MSSKEVLLEPFGTTLSDGSDRDSGSIGADDGMLSPDLVDLFHQILFDLQVFDDHFDDPIRIPDTDRNHLPDCRASPGCRLSE